MRKFLASLLSVVLVPVAALALEFVDHTTGYKDGDSLSIAEKAAVSLLTNEGFVQGYPDGTFRPNRLLNRAEFLKIATTVAPLEIAVPAEGCFPDVHVEDWFMAYVCTAAGYEYVRGYPDGLFHPERNINYAEAVKILANMFGYDVTEGSGEFWYRPYLNEAGDRGVLIPGSIQPSDFLTRGQMARLAAAFYADAQSELSLYRDAEHGIFHSSSSSSSHTSSSNPSSSSSSALSSESTSSQHTAGPRFPARSQFLTLGERSEPIASASFFASLEPMNIRGVKVVMKGDYQSIDSMYLVDVNGEQLGRLSLDPFDTTDKTWKASFGSGTGKHFDKDSENVLGIEVLLKGRNEGGRSEELVQVDKFMLTVEGEWSGDTYENIPADIPYPQHQTAQAQITDVRNALGATDSLPLGNDQLVAGFSFKGEAIPQAQLVLETLEFDVSKASSVTVSGFELGATDTSTRTPCSLNGTTVTCSSLPVELGNIGSSLRQLRLFADVTLASGAQSPFLQISLNQPGSVGVNGAVRWTDGTGHFTWVDMEAPVARGTRFE